MDDDDFALSELCVWKRGRALSTRSLDWKSHNKPKHIKEGERGKALSAQSGANRKSPGRHEPPGPVVGV